METETHESDEAHISDEEPHGNEEVEAVLVSEDAILDSEGTHIDSSYDAHESDAVGIILRDASDQNFDEVLVKLVSFYEGRLEKQKEELMSQFTTMMSNASHHPVKHDQYDHATQVEIDKGTARQSIISDEAGVHHETDSARGGLSKKKETQLLVDEDDAVIEVDIRPPSAFRHTHGSLPVETANGKISEVIDVDADSDNAVPRSFNDATKEPANDLTNFDGEENFPKQLGSSSSNASSMEKGDGDSPDDADADLKIQDPSVNKLDECSLPHSDGGDQSPRLSESFRNVEPLTPTEETKKHQLSHELPNSAFLFDLCDPYRRSKSTTPTPSRSHFRAHCAQFQPTVYASATARARCDSPLRSSVDHCAQSIQNESIRLQLHQKHQRQIADLKAYYEEELEELRSRLRLLTNRTEQDMVNRQTNTTPHRNGSSELERECSSLKKRCEWLESAYRNATTRLNDSEQQCESLATKLSTFTLRAQDGEADICDLKAECQSKDSEIENLIAQNSRLAVELDESNRLLEMKDTSLNDSDSMLNRLMRDYNALSKEYEGLKARFDVCDSTLSDAKSELAATRRTLNNLQFEYRRSEREKDVLQKRLQLASSFKISERCEVQQPLSSTAARTFLDTVREKPSLLSSRRTVATNVDNYSSLNAPSVASSNIVRNLGQQTSFTEFSDEDEVDMGNRGILEAEREVFPSHSKQPVTAAPPRRPAALTDHYHPHKHTGDHGKHSQPMCVEPHRPTESPSGMTVEQQYDALLAERQRIESALNRMPANPSNQAGRENKRNLEAYMDEVEKIIASHRFALKRSSVIRSSLN